MIMLFDKFERYIGANRLFSKDDRVLLAVSGGVDSMTMLALFAKAGYDAGVAHCNFQLRGSESDEDEILVEKEALRYGFPIYNKRFDTQAEIDRSGDSLQMVARRLRYEWFDGLCAEHGYTHIAIAHQADDSVETFFINLLRGTGLRGLTGINVINGRVVRPLLFAQRRELVEYAIENKVPYREDSSNSSTKYLRNKIRLGVIPRIREIDPQFTDTMTENVEHLTDAQTFIDGQMRIIREKAVEKTGDRVIIDPDSVDAALPLRFVVFEIMNEYGFRGEVIDSLLRCLAENSTGRKFYSRERVAYTDRGRIVITPVEDGDTCETEIPEGTPRMYACGLFFGFESIDPEDVDTLNRKDNVAFLDEDKLKFPLVVRRWKDGDSFVPLGMTGRKKVSDFLIDRKVSLPDKRRQLVVTSGDDIVWLVDGRIDDRYKVEPSTVNVMRITRIIQ